MKVLINWQNRPANWGVFRTKKTMGKKVLDIYFLHSPFCRAEGLCQQAAIKLQQVQLTPNGPIRVKQVNQISSVIG